MKALYLAMALLLLFPGVLWAQDTAAAPEPVQDAGDTAGQLAAEASPDTVQAEAQPEAQGEEFESIANATKILNDQFPSLQAQLSYALGVHHSRQQKELDYVLDEEYFLLAVQQVFNDEPQYLTKQEALNTVKSWQKQRQAAQYNEATRVRTRDEIEYHTLKASNGFPEQIGNSTLVLGGELMDDFIRMDAKSYGFTVSKFFDTIEWGMQGAISNATWNQLADNKWEVHVGTLYRGQEPHLDILEMDYQPEANETIFSAYSVDGEKRVGPALREAYENVLRLYQKQ